MGFIILLLASCTKDSTIKISDDYNKHLELRELGCEPVITAGCYSTTRYYSLVHPLFPGCNFNVEVKIVKCLTPYQVSFYDFKIINHDCPDFETFIDNCNISGTLDSCINLINHGFQEAMSVKEIILYDSPFQPVLATFHFYFATCSQYCYYEDFDEITSTSFMNYKTIPCSDGCCKRTLRYRYIESGLKLIESSTQQISGSGCDFLLQVFPCPFNSTITTNCILNCN